VKVRDLREGWTGSGYEGQRERRLCDVAAEIDVPLSTAKDGYKRAFARIVGRPFNTDLWTVLFLTLKLESSLRKSWRTRRSKSQTRAISLTRPRSRRKVPGKTRDGMNGAVATQPANTDGDKTISEFNTHIIELLAKGMPVAEVAARLAVDFGFMATMTPEERSRLIQYITNAPNRLQ